MLNEAFSFIQSWKAEKAAMEVEKAIHSGLAATKVPA
jgi:succinyl-CoA:acetate CoA-transferase